MYLIRESGFSPGVSLWDHNPCFIIVVKSSRSGLDVVILIVTQQANHIITKWHKDVCIILQVCHEEVVTLAPAPARQEQVKKERKKESHTSITRSM